MLVVIELCGTFVLLMENPLVDPDAKIEIFQKFKSGDASFAQKMLTDRVVSPNLCDDLQCSLLHFVSANNHLSIAELLLHSGANPNLPGGSLQETPLHWYVDSFIH